MYSTVKFSAGKFANLADGAVVVEVSALDRIEINVKKDALFPPPPPPSLQCGSTGLMVTAVSERIPKQDSSGLPLIVSSVSSWVGLACCCPPLPLHISPSPVFWRKGEGSGVQDTFGCAVSLSLCMCVSVRTGGLQGKGVSLWTNPWQLFQEGVAAVRL